MTLSHERIREIWPTLSVDVQRRVMHTLSPSFLRINTYPPLSPTPPDVNEPIEALTFETVQLCAEMVRDAYMTNEVPRARSIYQNGLDEADMRELRNTYLGFDYGRAEHQLDALQHIHQQRLNELEIREIQERMSAAATFAEHRALQDNYRAAVNRYQLFSENPMATTSLFNTTATSGTTTGRYAAPTTATMDRHQPSIDDPVLLFNMKQNTHAVLLRKLRSEYANDVFRFDFNVPIWRLFEEDKSMIREYSAAVRRLAAAKIAYQAETRTKYRAQLLSIINNNFTSRDTSWIISPDGDIKLTRDYGLMMEYLEGYRAKRIDYRHYYRRYGAKQADYNRRAAMIRQKPELYITINRQQLVDTVMQWDNVWGIDTYIDRDSGSLYIRIGLCDIVMSESASESYYDEPMDILLAPFYTTIKLSTTGNAIVSSRDGNTRGLSRSNLGAVGHDIHPHQLSDQPCFGTFGQTLIDLANNGDLVSYIGTIIAFYSQYNSQDSAGVAARLYHPSNLAFWENEENFINRLTSGMNGLHTHTAVNSDKFNAAIERYRVYHQECSNQDAPDIAPCVERCASCGQEPVGDDDCYYVTHYDSRVCSGCWEEHYCEVCERTNDDCECERSED